MNKEEQEKKAKGSGASEVKIAIMDGLIDIVENEGKVGFLIKEDGELRFLTKMGRGGKTYIPPKRSQIPFLLPRFSEVKKYYSSDTDEDLYDGLIHYHVEISELPSNNLYCLIVAWDMHTYLLEQVNYSPIICFDGVYEMGKTRTGTGMINVAYRGISVESLREAHIFRFASYYGGAMFFDVRDFWTKCLKKGSDDIFLKRFEKGAKVPRVKDFRKKAFEDMEYYDVFGPTIIATNEPVSPILESRGITINMRKSNWNFEEITDDLYLPLKERLVAFRARHYKKVLPDVKRFAKGRLGDILKPLFQVTKLANPDALSYLSSVIKDIRKGKDYEKARSREAYLLKAAWMCRGKVGGGLLLISEITEYLENMENIKIGNKTVSTKFKQMGFKTDRTANNLSAIVFDEDYLKAQMNTYMVDLSPDSPLSPDK